MDLGTDLREARERAGFSLSDLAARTRIPLSSLRAMEQNDFAKLPPGIFVRSFIRSYAHEVGVDPVSAVAEFRAMTEPAEEPAPAEQEQVIDRMELGSYLPDFAESRPGWGYALIVAAMLIAVIGINRQTPQEASNDTTAAPAAEASVEAPQPVATTGTATGLRVEMRTERVCWVKAVSTGVRRSRANCSRAKRSRSALNATSSSESAIRRRSSTRSMAVPASRLAPRTFR